MACCIVAAFLLAQFVAFLRRCGVFWGLLPTPAGEAADTVYTRLATWARKPVVRHAFTAALVLELGAGGAWLYAGHGRHVAEEVDVALSRLRGEWAIYTGVCSEAGDRTRARLVLSDAAHAEPAQARIIN